MKPAILCATILLSCLSFSASAHAAEATPSPQPASGPASDSALEAKYRAEFEKKVGEQAVRQQQSLESLFYSMGAAALVLLLLGISTALKTRRLEQELARINERHDSA